MSDQEASRQNVQQFGNQVASADSSDHAFRRSSRWDSSCKSQNMSADLYLELLKSPPRRQIRVGGVPDFSAQQTYAAKLASDEDWTETTASESFSGETSLGSSMSSLGVTASTNSPYPSDHWNSPMQPMPSPLVTMHPAPRVQILSVQSVLAQNFPHLETIERKSELLSEDTVQAHAGAGRDKLLTLVEDDEEDATSSSRQDDSFHQTDDEFELLLSTGQLNEEPRPLLLEKESFSDASDNTYHKDEGEAGSIDDYSSSEYMSDDFLVEYVTSSDDESADDVPSTTEFHAPHTSVAFLDKLPTRPPSQQLLSLPDNSFLYSIPPNHQEWRDAEAASIHYSAKASLEACIAADKLHKLSLSDNSFQNHSDRYSFDATAKNGAALIAERYSDSLDCLPKLPRRRSASSSPEDDATLRSTGSAEAVGRKVRFAPTCTVQEYAVTVGDNPSCSGACALTLDWEHTPAYQQLHGQVGNIPGGLKCLALSSRRERVMQVQGLTEQKLRLLELQIANRISRNAWLTKMRRKDRAVHRSHADTPRNAAGAQRSHTLLSDL